MLLVVSYNSSSPRMGCSCRIQFVRFSSSSVSVFASSHTHTHTHTIIHIVLFLKIRNIGLVQQLTRVSAQIGLRDRIHRFGMRGYANGMPIFTDWDTCVPIIIGVIVTEMIVGLGPTVFVLVSELKTGFKRV